MNEIEIRKFLTCKEVKEVWKEIQQELPHLLYCKNVSEERIDACVDFLYYNISICNDLLKEHYIPIPNFTDFTNILSNCKKLFIDFCCKTLLYRNETEFDIDDLPYSLEEFDMTEEELKQLYENSDYDCSYLVSDLIEFYLLKTHPSLLKEYYERQAIRDFEKQAIDIGIIFSLLNQRS